MSIPVERIVAGVWEVRHVTMPGGVFLAQVDDVLGVRVIALDGNQFFDSVAGAIAAGWQFTARYVRCAGGEPVECWASLSTLGWRPEFSVSRDELSAHDLHEDLVTKTPRRVVKGVFVAQAKGPSDATA